MNDKVTISTFQLFSMFHDSESARRYFEGRLWPDGATCPVCSSRECVTPRKAGFYRCNTCSEDFTIRTGTVMERSHVPLHKWAIACGLIGQRPEIPSAELGAALQVTQKTGWLILRRVHEAAGELLAANLVSDTTERKYVTAWPAYSVCADGSIWTRWRRGRGGRLGLEWRRLNPSPDKDGYRVVRLYGAGGTWKQLRVAPLVCAAFHGPCPRGQECRHLDGVNTNDAQDNLAWGTSVENKADMKCHGTAPLGETHHNATLSDAKVARIRALKGKRLQREVAEEFRITQGYVSELWSARKRTREGAVA